MFQQLIYVAVTLAAVHYFGLFCWYGLGSPGKRSEPRADVYDSNYESYLPLRVGDPVWARSYFRQFPVKGMPFRELWGIRCSIASINDDGTVDIDMPVTRDGATVVYRCPSIDRDFLCNENYALSPRDTVPA